MATLAELQERLDKKTFDASQLSPEQEAAVDYMFETGQLQGYKNVAEVKKERELGAIAVAEEKTKRAQPFTTATEGLLPFSDKGIERRDMELTGDVAGGFSVYIKDAPKIAAALRSDPKLGGIDKARAMQMNLNKATNFMANLPYIRNIKLLRNTSRAIGRVADGLRLVSGAPSQLLQTELKAQAASAVGAAGGSILYDVANLGTDFKNAAFLDLSEVSNNDIKKLPYAEQVLVHGAEAAKNALFFNAFGSALLPVLGTTMRGLKGPLGIGSKEAKEMTEMAAAKGMALDISSVASEKGLFGKFVNTFWKTVGVFPTIGFFKKRQRKIIEQKAISAWLDEITAQAPIEHQAFLSMKFLPTFKQNFESFYNQYKVKYAHVANIADALGNPQIVPTDALRARAKGFLDIIKQQYPNAFQEAQTLAKQGTTEFGDPLVAIVSVLDNLGSTITPKQYQGIIKSIWRGANTSKLEGFQDTFFGLMTAAKEDFYKVGNPENLNAYLGSQAFKQSYDEILQTSGKQAADDYAKKITLGLANFHDELTMANKFFSEGTQTFNSNVAKQIENTDANIFATKGLLNVQKEGRIPLTKMWDKTIKQFYQYGDAGTLNDFRLLVNADKPGLGQEMFNRGRTLYLAEAMLKGFKKNPGIPTKPFFQMMDEARNMGVINLKNSDDLYEMTGTKLRQELKSIDPEAAIRNNIGTVPLRDIKASLKDAGTFDVNEFKKALGYNAPTDRGPLLDKFTEMYGGGKKGRESANNLLKLIDILDKEFSTEIADVSTFMSRRFVLGGLGAIGGLAGVGIATGISGIITFGLLAGGAGFALSNPKALKYMLDVYTDMERMQRAQTKASPTVPKSLIRLLNYASQEDKDFPKIDPKKINFEEVTNYIYNKNILIPQLGFDLNVIRRDIRDRMYPELKQIEKGNSIDATKGVNYLNGSALGQLQAEQVVNYQPQQTQPQQPQPQQAAIPTPQPQSTGQMNVPRSAMVQSLFPNDPYSLAIAQRQDMQGQ